MSTGVIVAIVVVAVILIALLLAIPRMRSRAAERRRERELSERREQAVAGHRQAAEVGVGRAEEAEHRARLANAVAERERAEARLHEERARAHERGMNDDELMSEERYGDGRERVAQPGGGVGDDVDAGDGSTTVSERGYGESADPGAPVEREQNVDR